MTQLARVRARRREVVAEIGATRIGLCAAARHTRGLAAPLALGFGLGRALAGGRWLRVFAVAGVLLTALRRLAGAR